MGLNEDRQFLQQTNLVFAVFSVAGATAACATRGDARTVEMLARYYSLVAEAIRDREGRVVKVIGDGVLVTFPASQAAQAAQVIRSGQKRATELWQSFDPRCHVQVKLGIGPLMEGLLGPPGLERPDVYGDALNQLFKMPGGDLVISPALQNVLHGEGNRAS